MANPGELPRFFRLSCLFTLEARTTHLDETGIPKDFSLTKLDAPNGHPPGALPLRALPRPPPPSPSPRLPPHRRRTQGPPSVVAGAPSPPPAGSGPLLPTPPPPAGGAHWRPSCLPAAPSPSRTSLLLSSPSLPSVAAHFTSHMVLQRAAAACVWGAASHAGAALTVALANDGRVVAAQPSRARQAGSAIRCVPAAVG